MTNIQITCTVDTCSKNVVAKGRCSAHYDHWRQYENPNRVPCKVEGCEVGARTKGFCKLHYNRFKRHGDPLIGGHLPVMERFWAKVDKSAGPDGCWIWTGSITSSGYGQFAPGATEFTENRVPMLAHRFIKQHLEGRKLRRDEQVMHSCDNPPCCNPAHLSIGTASENIADAVAKGRFKNRYGRGRQKFTDDDVAEIRRRCAEGETQASVAEDFGTYASYVNLIVNRKVRANVSEAA